MIWPERRRELERRDGLVRLGLRGVDRLLHGVEVALADGDVNGLGADADRDVDLLAEHLAGFGFVFRHGDRERVEIDALVRGGVPLDAVEFGFFLSDRGELLQAALELGGVLDLSAGDERQLVGAEVQRRRRRPSGRIPSWLGRRP